MFARPCSGYFFPLIAASLPSRSNQYLWSQDSRLLLMESTSDCSKEARFPWLAGNCGQCDSIYQSIASSPLMCILSNDAQQNKPTKINDNADTLARGLHAMSVAISTLKPSKGQAASLVLDFQRREVVLANFHRWLPTAW